MIYEAGSRWLEAHERIGAGPRRKEESDADVQRATIPDLTVRRRKCRYKKEPPGEVVLAPDGMRVPHKERTSLRS